MRQKQVSKKKKEEVKFKAREGSRLTDNQAELYGKHIKKLMKVSSIKMVTAEMVLQDAKNEYSPYHDWFNWDDDLAAEEYRKAQARQLLSSIVEVRIIHEDSEPVEIRAFVNVIDEEGERGYVETDYAMSKPVLVSQVIQQALKEVIAWQKRYREYQELGKIHKAITETSEEFDI